MTEIVCPSCLFPNRRGAKFCAACGRPLTDGASDTDDESPTVPGTMAEAATLPAGEGQAHADLHDVVLHVGCKTDVGRVRQSNEDSLFVLEFQSANNSIIRPAGLFVLADGMGGHEGGEIASGMLVRALGRRAANEWLTQAIDFRGELVDRGAWLAGAIQMANKDIYDWATENHCEMGTTVVAALIENSTALIAHVGDSRAYRVNSAGIERLTVDHSLVESLVAARQLKPEEARNHPQANVIYRTVGDQPQVVVDLKKVRLYPGDRLLLCSDGLNGMLPDETISELAMAAGSPEAACEALVQAANAAGGEDNCSVILIELRPA